MSADERQARRVPLLAALCCCLDAYPSHQRFQSETTPVSAESLYAGYGPRDEEPRHRPSTDAAAGGNLRVAGYGRALTKRVK